MTARERVASFLCIRFFLSGLSRTPTYCIRRATGYATGYPISRPEPGQGIREGLEDNVGVGVPRAFSEHLLVRIALRLQHLRHPLVREHPVAMRRLFSFRAVVELADVKPDAKRLSFGVRNQRGMVFPRPVRYAGFDPRA